MCKFWINSSKRTRSIKHLNSFGWSFIPAAILLRDTHPRQIKTLAPLFVSSLLPTSDASPAVFPATPRFLQPLPKCTLAGSSVPSILQLSGDYFLHFRRPAACFSGKISFSPVISRWLEPVGITCLIFLSIRTWKQPCGYRSIYAYQTVNGWIYISGELDRFPATSPLFLTDLGHHSHPSHGGRWWWSNTWT